MIRADKLYRRLPLSPTSDMDTEGLPRDAECSRCDHLGGHTPCMPAELSMVGGGTYNVDTPALVIVSDHPGSREDAAGRPMMGASGTMLRKQIAKHWAGPIFIDNALKCFGPDTPVSAIGAVSLYRRAYTGPMVRVSTIDGGFLTGTPNHPALTQRGWVALGSIQKGDHLVSGAAAQRAALGNPDVDHGPATFGELYDALAQAGVTERRAGTDVDFHGDGGNAEVEVVPINGHLRNRLESTLDEHGLELFLESANHLPADVQPSSAPSETLLDRLSRPLHSANGCVGSSGYRTPLVWGALREPSSLRLAAPANLDTVGAEPANHHGGADAELLPELLRGDAGRVALNEVIDVQTTEFSGHVFNLHTENGWYTASGYVVHNCTPKKEVAEDAVDTCRAFTAERLRELANPVDRILACGTWATYAMLGHKVPVLSARGGYGWWLDERRVEYVDHIGDAMVPVYILPNPAAAIRNRFLLRDFEQDIAHAIKRENPRFAAIDTQLRVVRTREDALDFYEWAQAQSAVAYDTETSGRMFNTNFRIEALSFASPDDPNAVWCFGREALADPMIRVWALSILANEDIPKIGHNLKYDVLAVWCAFQAYVNGEFQDTRLIRKLLEPEIDGGLAVAAELVGMGGHKKESRAAIEAICKDLAALAGEPLRKPLASGKDRKPATLKVLDRAKVDARHLEEIRAGEDTKSFAYHYLEDDILHRYNGMDALSTALLYGAVYPRLAAIPGRKCIYDTITMPATRALIEAEKHGLILDLEANQQFSSYLDMQLAPVIARLKVYGDINYDSPKQLGELLYKKLGITPPRNSETATGQPGTGEEVLQQLAGKHRIVADILAYRSLKKLKGTYADSLPQHVRDDGRIHSSFLLDGTGCLPAGELVLTDRGYIPAEDVRIGDSVISHMGVSRPVTRVTINAPAPVYRVTLDNGLELRTTPDHLYLSDGQWLRADQLDLLDGVVVHARSAERWASVPEWSAYEVSSWGRVRSTRTARMLHPQRKGKWGHLKVTLYRNGARSRANGDGRDFAVHKLVMTAFGPPKKDGQIEVRHLNGTAWDNSIDNLAWGTPAENRADASGHGTMSKRGKHPQCRLTEEQVSEIRATKRPPKGGAGRWDKSLGTSDSELAARYGVVREAIRDIRSNKRWKPETHIVGKRVQFARALVCAISVEPAEVSYGATVDVDHSHVTGGIVTHNTGRASSQDPNFQNMPSPDRDEEGGTQYGHMARGQFIAVAGYLLLEVDTKQQEARVAAMLSKDPVLIGCFVGNEDIHKTTASAVYGIKPENVTKKQRTDCKTVFFGLMYGKTDYGLAKQLGITEAEAARIRAVILGRFKVFAAWAKEQVRKVHETGGTYTWWAGHAEARYRPLYGIAAQGEEGSGQRFNAENSAVNTPIQGTAGDFVTGSLWPLVKGMREQGLDAFLCNTVHDSMMVMVRKGQELAVAKIMRDAILGHDSAGVPLGVDFKIGESWGSMEEYRPFGDK